MIKSKQILKQLPKSERDLLIFEMRRQMSLWLFKSIMNSIKIKSTAQLLRSIDFYKTEHGFDFWCRIYQREITPKWVRKEMGYDN